MNFICNFPFFTIILSLACAVVTFLMRPKAGRIVTISLLSLSAALSASTLAYNVVNGGEFVYTMGHFPAPFGNEIVAGMIEPLFALLFEVVMLLCVVGGKTRIEADIVRSKQNLYYVMIDLAHVALIALAYTNDIFTGYVFVEICTLASCALLTIRNNDTSTVATMRYLIFSLLGSGLFLIGVILLYAVTGHLLFPQLSETVAALWASHEYRMPLTVVMGLIVIGLGIKSGLFPFHFWMPDTYGSATPTSSGILSGLISKGYIVLLIRIVYRVFSPEVFYSSGVGNVLFILGVCGMVVGSVSAIRSKYATEMVSYSSASQIGYIYMGLGLGTSAAVVSVVVQIFSHAIAKPALFLSLSELCESNDDHVQRTSLTGAAHRHRFAGVMFTAAALSIVGIPLFIGFVPKLLLSLASFASPGKTVAALVALAVSTVLNVAYFLFTILRIYSPSDRSVPGAHVKNPCLVAAGTVFIILLILGGLLPQYLIALVSDGLAIM